LPQFAPAFAPAKGTIKNAAVTAGHGHDTARSIAALLALAELAACSAPANAADAPEPTEISCPGTPAPSPWLVVAAPTCACPTAGAPAGAELGMTAPT